MGKPHQLFLVLVISGTISAEYGDRIKNYTETWGDNLDMQESRYRGYALPPPVRHQTEIPITFQAPYINAKNYWGDSGRRTAYDYDQHNALDILPRPITEGLNSFYGMMNHFFGSEEPPRRRPNYHQPPRQYDDYPYYYTPKPHYLPGPKPVRATVIKLEAPRPTPHYSTPVIDYTTTAKYYPQFVKLLNDVLIENAYENQAPAYGFGELSPVLEKPEYVQEFIAPTTYKPKSPHFKPTPPASIQDKLPPAKQGQDTRIPYITEPSSTQQSVRAPQTIHNSVNLKKQPTTGTPIVFPDSSSTVPPRDYEIDVRNAQHTITRAPSFRPVTFESSTRASTTTSTTEAAPTRPSPIEIVTIRATRPGPEKSNFVNVETIRNSVETRLQSYVKVDFNEQIQDTTTTIPETTTMPSEESTTQSAPVSVTNPPLNEDATEASTEKLSVLPTDTTTQVVLFPDGSENRPVLTPILNTMERLEHSPTRSPFPKKLHSQKVTTDATNSADYVTDLTLRGLAGRRDIPAPRKTSLVNMNRVIGYEIGKLNATAPPPLPDFSDELSLDAKILKDTNWDGYQAKIATTTAAPTEESTTTMLVMTTTMLPPTTNSPTTTEAIMATTVYTVLPETTTLLPKEQSTEIVSTRMTKSVSRSLRPRFSPRARTTESELTERLSRRPPNFQEKFEIASFMEEATTVEPEVSTRARQYRRKPKVQSFTPYPKIDEREDKKPLQLGSLTRPFYPKRSRPNATLTFKKKERVDNTSEEIKEAPKRSPSGTRRNIYRKRTYPSQLRRSNVSTEEPQLR